VAGRTESEQKEFKQRIREKTRTINKIRYEEDNAKLSKKSSKKCSCGARK